MLRTVNKSFDGRNHCSIISEGKKVRTTNTSLKLILSKFYQRVDEKNLYVVVAYAKSNSQIDHKSHTIALKMKERTLKITSESTKEDEVVSNLC